MPNNQVTYTSITSETGGSHPFTLNPASGAVSVNGLNYETEPSFTLTITAEDGGMPSNTAEAKLYVTVLVSSPFICLNTNIVDLAMCGYTSYSASHSQPMKMLQCLMTRCTQHRSQRISMLMEKLG